MWELLGGRPAPLYSMEWMHVLRPAGAAVALAAEHVALAKFLHPVGALADRLFARFMPSPAPDDQLAASVSVVELGEPAMADVLPRVSAHYALRPDWTAEQLRWRLAQAEHKERFGDFVRGVAIGRGDTVLGCFLYHLRRNGIATVLQLLAPPNAAEAVVSALIRHAEARGAVALRGRSQPDMLDALLRRTSFLRHRTAMMVHAADPDVLDAIARGDALLTGLAAESGTRLVGDILA
jgi:hypothetical protein